MGLAETNRERILGAKQILERVLGPEDRTKPQKLT
jgi:hypothetical protein